MSQHKFQENMTKVRQYKLVLVDKERKKKHNWDAHILQVLICTSTLVILALRAAASASRILRVFRAWDWAVQSIFLPSTPYIEDGRTKRAKNKIDFQYVSSREVVLKSPDKN